MILFPRWSLTPEPHPSGYAGVRLVYWRRSKTQRRNERSLEGTENVFLSTASLWELGIKSGLGKLETKIDLPLVDWIERIPMLESIAILQIESRHILRAAALPYHHRDSFDRMIVAQALEDGLTVVGADPAFDAYGVRRIF